MPNGAKQRVQNTFFKIPRENPTGCFVLIGLNSLYKSCAWATKLKNVLGVKLAAEKFLPVCTPDKHICFILILQILILPPVYPSSKT